MFKDFQFKKFREDVESALKPLEEMYGIKVSAGTVVYDNSGFRLTLGAEKPTDIAERAKFMSKCREYGFEPRDYKRTIKINNMEYLFVGFNDNDRYPCSVLNIADGKVYNASEDFVENGLVAIVSKSENEIDNSGLTIFDM